MCLCMCVHAYVCEREERGGERSVHIIFSSFSPAVEVSGVGKGNLESREVIWIKETK